MRDRSTHSVLCITHINRVPSTLCIHDFSSRNEFSYTFWTEIEVALYRNIISEMTKRMSQEGLPYMRLFGIWARISVDDDDITRFCRYYGYGNGQKVSSVRTYGGYIWENFPSFECLLNRGSKCMKVSSVKLQNEWYDGQYVKCVNDSELELFSGEFISSTFWHWPTDLDQSNLSNEKY